jgi:sialic acid synthase SpsE
MIFVAEIGSNHKGELAIAHEMIRQAALAGADIAKFQFRDPDDEIRGLAIRNPSQLASWCEHYGIEFVASIFSFEALEVARSIGMPRLKIAHSVARSNSVLCGAIAEGPEEVFVSHGDYYFANWHRLFVIPRYPTYPDELVIPEVFGDKWYGYSSHAYGIADALVAIARGAKYVEKHVTLDKTETSIKDNHFALTFEEFQAMAFIGTEMARLV